MKNKMVKLSIILVHYNNIQDLKDYFGWLNDQTFKDYEVIIMDNLSKYKEIMNLNFFIKKFKHYNNFDIKLFYQTNKGYSGGINQGIRKSSGNIILVSNIDISFGPDFLRNAVKYINNNNCDILSPKIYYYPDTGRIWSSGGFFDFTNYRNPQLENKEIDKITEVDFVSGCCMFVKQDVFKKVKLFDKNFFMYFEDTDFCYRAKQMGFKIIFHPEIVIYHNIDEEKERQSELVKINYFKSRLLFIFKHYPLKLLIYSLSATVFITLVAFLKSKIKNRFIKGLKVIINGIILGLRVRFLWK